MLKKAGIIATVATAGVLALAPLAFADEESGNISNDCSFQNESGDVEQGLFGGGGLVGGLADAITGTATSAVTQTNTGNCTNVNTEDVTDTDSNNETETVEKTMIEDSFNDED